MDCGEECGKLDCSYSVFVYLCVCVRVCVCVCVWLQGVHVVLGLHVYCVSMTLTILCNAFQCDVCVKCEGMGCEDVTSVLYVRVCHM